ncbi:hypothetical protein BKA83DRAFT_4300665 [Pisolithus microcarpus]|nr:hypothetical protein BKA83DRAFT_4300502 [Pisolithus microcarpus]KAI6020355.1 hypothetical protein BKA83DRAFT_4300665 [Pisolithus microcarpus]
MASPKLQFFKMGLTFTLVSLEVTHAGQRQVVIFLGYDCVATRERHSGGGASRGHFCRTAEDQKFGAAPLIQRR